MKKFYVILGQTKNKEKLPVCFTGWFANKAKVVEALDEEADYLYGYSHTLWQFVKRQFSSKDIDDECVWLEDLE